jgi:hypothetical protein
MISFEPATLGPAVDVMASPSGADLDDLAALVREAGWNQIAADWCMLIEVGSVFAVRSKEGRIVATLAMLPYGSRFAWLSQLLVAGSYRRMPAVWATASRVLNDLAAAGIAVALDATPAGRNLYGCLGFQASWGLHWLARREYGRAVDLSSAPEDVTIEAITDHDWAALCTYDAAAFGADRQSMLMRLRGRLTPAELVARRNGCIAGFILGRDGRVAPQIGPLIADDDMIAHALLSRALSTLAGPVLIACADAKVKLRAWLEAKGFAAQRPLTRMIYQREKVVMDAKRTFAVVGPEFG